MYTTGIIVIILRLFIVRLYYRYYTDRCEDNAIGPGVDSGVLWCKHRNKRNGNFEEKNQHINSKNILEKSLVALLEKLRFFILFPF